MTNEEAIELLKMCKPLAVRLIAIPRSINPVNIVVSPDDLSVMRGYAQVQADPITAGPGLLNRLCKLAELSQVEIYKLDQLKQMIYNRKFGSRIANTRFKTGSNPEKQSSSDPLL